MSFQESIRDILLAESDITDFVGQRIRPDQLDESDPLPALIIELDSFDGLETLDQAAGDTGELTITVVCCGSTRSQATDLEQIVRDTLDGYVGTSGDFTFNPITFVSIDYDHEPDDAGGESDDWFINAISFDAWVDQV